MASLRTFALAVCMAAAEAQLYSSSFTSAYWTYTSRYQASPSASEYTNTRYSSTTTYTYTATRTIAPTITPTASPTKTSTYLMSYSDLEIVYAYYAPSAVAESNLLPDTRSSSGTTTLTTDTRIYFSMPVTVTAPASCPTQFTVTSTASMSNIPSIVSNQLKPSSVRTGTTSTGIYGIYATETWYLTPSAAPYTPTSDIYYRLYVASCSKPPSSQSTGTLTSGGSSSNNSDDDYSYYCSRSRYSYYCGSGLKTWIIVIASVIPGLFLLGFLESWFWFRRLMRGKSAMRLGTISWLLISLWILCFTRMQDARSKEDQKVLQEKWKAMGSGAALKAWFKYGFRHRYPEELLGQYSKNTIGVVPPGQPLNSTPAMMQTTPFIPGASGVPGASGAMPPTQPGQPGPVYYYGPPPGWIPTPDGKGFMPPPGQSYAYPVPGSHASYYGSDAAKDGSMVSASPVSALHAPQPMYSQQGPHQGGFVPGPQPQMQPSMQPQEQQPVPMMQHPSPPLHAASEVSAESVPHASGAVVHPASAPAPGSAPPPPR